MPLLMFGLPEVSIKSMICFPLRIFSLQTILSSWRQLGRAVMSQGQNQQDLGLWELYGSGYWISGLVRFSSVDDPRDVEPLITEARRIFNTALQSHPLPVEFPQLDGSQPDKLTASLPSIAQFYGENLAPRLELLQVVILDEFPRHFFLPYCMFSFSGSHDSPKQTHFYSVSLRWFVGRFVLATGVNGDWQFAARYHIWLRVFMSFKASGSWLPVRSRVVAPSVSISLYICFMHVLEKSRPPLVCWTPLSYLSTIFHDSYSYTEFPTAPVVTQSDQDCASLRVKQSG